MNRLLQTIIFSLLASITYAASPYDNPDTIVVARDGTGQFRNIADAIEVCRAFMDYHKVIYIKKGTYKEKVIIPQWVQNIELCGESREETIITYDDHANILYRQVLESDVVGIHPDGIGAEGTYTLARRRIEDVGMVVVGDDGLLTTLATEFNVLHPLWDNHFLLVGTLLDVDNFVIVHEGATHLDGIRNVTELASAVACHDNCIGIVVG